MTLKELIDRKQIAVKAYREIIDKTDSEKRRLTSEESGQLDTLEKEIDSANDEIKTLEAEDKRRKYAAIAEESMRQPVLPSGLERAGTDGSVPQVRRSLLDRVVSLREDEGISTQQAIARISRERDARTPAISQFLRQFILTGMVDRQVADRAGLQMDVDSQGGFLVMPELFIARLIADLDRNVVMRGLSTVIPLPGHASLGVPTRDTDLGDLTWTTELLVGSEDTSLAYGKRGLTPHPCARYIKVSKDLLRIAAISPEAEVRQRIAYKAGTVQEAAFMTGTGAGQPLGVFTASASGISTSRDISTGNTSTSIQTDGLINAKYNLESQWLTNSNLKWLFHRLAVSQIMKLKDGDGQYIWKPGIVNDPNDRILGIPVVMSEYAPSTFTASQYVGLLGDFSYYWIVDRMSLEIQRLTELFALTNQDGFIARFSCDGAPILQTAFSRVTLSA